jgi:indolepyruvate ferredoxin oxidoreductase beta subunit
MNDRFRLLLVGVGGQGVLTAARYIGDAAFAAGLEVMAGQLHGLSQRRGSVRSTVLIGPGRSSFIARGEADLVLGLEPLEVLRARPEMSARTRVVMNRGLIATPTSIQGGIEYPDTERILAEVRAVAPDVVEVDGPAVVQAVGSAHVLNVAMLGALAGLAILPLDGESLWKAIETRCPPQHLEANRRAFALGRDQVAA